MRTWYHYVDGVDDYFHHDRILHRIDGPAVEYWYGSMEFFIEGERLSKEQFEEINSGIRAMSTVQRLTDPRWWVRSYELQHSR